MIRVTNHAVIRFQERVSNVSKPEVLAALDTPAMALAQRIGACSVILATGHRAIIQDHVVVTILPPRKRHHHARRIATNTTWEDETP